MTRGQLVRACDSRDCLLSPGSDLRRKSIEDSRRRPASVASSIGPQASKNWRSCLRAFSSSQLRFLREDFKEAVDGRFAIAFGVEEQREVEARLVVGRDRRRSSLRARRRRRGRRSAPARSIWARTADDPRVVRRRSRAASPASGVARSSSPRGDEAPGEPGDRRDRLGLELQRLPRNALPAPVASPPRAASRPRRRAPRRRPGRLGGPATRAMKALTWLSGSAPTKPSTGWPLRRR